MTLIKKFSAPLIAVALVAMMAVSLVGQTPRTASAALATAGEVCRSALGQTSTILGNSGSNGAITSVNSGSTTTMRIHFDDAAAAATVSMRVSGGLVNGTAAAAQSAFFTTTVGTTLLCTASGLGQTYDDVVLGALADTYIQFSFTAPTLPSGIQSQVVEFTVDGDNSTSGVIPAGATAGPDARYFLTVATAASTITVGTSDDLNITATPPGGASDVSGAQIVATVKDAAGTNIVGATVDVVSTAGGFDQTVVGTCDAGVGADLVANNGDDDVTGPAVSQACSAQTNANGQISPTLYGLGAGGTSTVTFTVRGTAVTGSTTVIISALPATLELSGRRSNTATSFISKTIVRNSDSSTTIQDELMIAAVAKDANGNVVGAGVVTFTLTGPAGNTVTFQSVVNDAATTMAITGLACNNAGINGVGTTSCTDAIEASAVGATTPSHALAYIDIDSSTGEPLGTYTVTATIPGNNATITGTTTFTLAKAPATLTVADIPLIGLGESVPVAITCKDTDGNPCAGGTIVQVNVSNANLIAQNTATGATGVTVADLTTSTTTGIATVNLIGVTAGTTNIVANVGTITAVKLANVGSVPATPPPATPPAGTGFSGGTIAAAGVSIVSFTGTTAQLATAGATAKAVSVTATVGGKMVTYVVGAPDFVNAEWNAAFKDSYTTLVIIKTGS